MKRIYLCQVMTMWSSLADVNQSVNHWVLFGLFSIALTWEWMPSLGCFEGVRRKHQVFVMGNVAIFHNEHASIHVEMSVTRISIKE